MILYMGTRPDQAAHIREECAPATASPVEVDEERFSHLLDIGKVCRYCEDHHFDPSGTIRRERQRRVRMEQMRRYRARKRGDQESLDRCKAKLEAMRKARKRPSSISDEEVRRLLEEWRGENEPRHGHSTLGCGPFRLAVPLEEQAPSRP